MLDKRFTGLYILNTKIVFNKCPLHQKKKTIIKLFSSTNLAFSFGMELRTFSKSTLVLLSSMRKIKVSAVQVNVAFVTIY